MERDTIFYMLDRSSAQARDFISGVVVGGGSDDVVVQFARPWLGVAVEETITLYFKQHGQFLTQDYHVSRVTEDDGGTRLKLVPVGDEPKVGDKRGSERIPTIQESMLARLGVLENCSVLDISTSGIAVMGGGNYQVGDVVEFELWMRQGRFVGEVSVRSAIEVRPGRFRYGLKCNADKPGHNLQGSLPQLWVELQIKYLEILTV